MPILNDFSLMCFNHTDKTIHRFYWFSTNQFYLCKNNPLLTSLSHVMRVITRARVTPCICRSTVTCRRGRTKWKYIIFWGKHFTDASLRWCTTSFKSVFCLLLIILWYNYKRKTKNDGYFKVSVFLCLGCIQNFKIRFVGPFTRLIYNNKD